MNAEIKPEAARFAIEQIKDGWVFEEFAQRFLTARFSYEFLPVGGSKDKGIDGIEHTFERKAFPRQLFQITTEKDAQGKIKHTIETLKKNKKDFQNITYVTSRKLNNKDELINQFQDNLNVNIRIFDVDWFVVNIGFNQGTRNAYFAFIDSHLHEFSKPGKSYIVHDMDTDARLYVFLRQQLDSKWHDAKVDDLLADSLILFALEGTDPDTAKFKTEEEVFSSIKEYVKFDPKILNDTIKNRLQILSQKPRKINYHKADNKYCLPYETRLEIMQRNLADKQLLEVFMEQTEQIVKGYLKENETNVRDVTSLINNVVHKIYYQQGLEF